MSVSGLCEVCGGSDVEFTCNRCASLVCDDHYVPESGLCVECQSEVGGSGDVPAGEDLPDDVDTYQF